MLDIERKAVIKRVEEILNGSKTVDSYYIKIEGARAEVTTIDYRFKEFVFPEDNDTKEDTK